MKYINKKYNKDNIIGLVAIVMLIVVTGSYGKKAHAETVDVMTNPELMEPLPNRSVDKPTLDKINKHLDELVTTQQKEKDYTEYKKRTKPVTPTKGVATKEN